MERILDSILKPNDIKNIKPEDYKLLARELRKFLIEKVSKTGGHLASNLGVVELTMALHLCLNFPEDKLVWDVGHQSYTHKLLTGRKDEFVTLRQMGGISGFPKKRESACDCFDTGHSSTSISAALGFAKARDLKGSKEKVFAVIGDGALSGGMAYEALNNAARLKTNMVIVLNDNNMSINENVGGMSKYLNQIRTNIKYKDLKLEVESALRNIPMIGQSIVDTIRSSKDSLKRLIIPGMLFEDMGITYLGPIDGHNIGQLEAAFSAALAMNEAVMVHVLTKKGKGYQPAQENPCKYHGIDSFVPKTGELRIKRTDKTYTEIFSETLTELASKDDKIVAITAAMASGTGLTEFRNRYKKRFFDVGIAEEHAVTFAAGLASGGLKPVVAIYSTFLQRAYDQILHDVCINKLPVIFAIDRAGIVGNDGETHQGIFDLSFLSHIPGMTVAAPKNGYELREMLAFAVDFDGPIAIRYPRGNAYTGLEDSRAKIEAGKSEIIAEEKDIVLLAVGSMVKVGKEVKDILNSEGFHATLVNVRFVSPMDEDMLHYVLENHHTIVTMEENVESGGFGQKVSAFLHRHKYDEVKLITVSLANDFVEHGAVEDLKEKLGLDPVTIAKNIMDGKKV